MGLFKDWVFNLFDMLDDSPARGLWDATSHHYSSLHQDTSRTLPDLGDPFNHGIGSIGHSSFDA